MCQGACGRIFASGERRFPCLSCSKVVCGHCGANRPSVDAATGLYSPRWLCTACLRLAEVEAAANAAASAAVAAVMGHSSLGPTTQGPLGPASPAVGAESSAASPHASAAPAAPAATSNPITMRAQATASAPPTPLASSPVPSSPLARHTAKPSATVAGGVDNVRASLVGASSTSGPSAEPGPAAAASGAASGAAQRPRGPMARGSRASGGLSSNQGLGTKRASPKPKPPSAFQ